MFSLKTYANTRLVRKLDDLGRGSLYSIILGKVV